jgi:hypothetical protein
MKTRSVWLVALAIASCDGVEVGNAEQELCDEMTCSNSPDVTFGGSHGGFHELNIRGLPNREGISIESVNGRAQIRKGERSFDLNSKNGRLLGIGLTSRIENADLVGADIHLMKDGQPLFAIRIDGVRSFLFPFGQPGTVEAYRMSWHRIDREPSPGQPTCPAALIPRGGDASQMLGMNPDETIVFEGDRFDRERKTVSRDRDDDWLNFGCAGHALAKLYLMRHTITTQPLPFDEASWQHRQAMLKMLVADYCGTGRAFTTPGQPLVWMTRGFPYALRPLGVEARWSAHGAICIGTPRLALHPAPDAGFSPDIMADIAAECPASLPPRCASDDPYETGGAAVISGNRPEI